MTLKINFTIFALFAVVPIVADVIGLKQRNIGMLENLAMNISDPTHPMYGRYQDASYINKLVGYTAAEVADISNVLTANNVTFKFYGDAFWTNSTVRGLSFNNSNIEFVLYDQAFPKNRYHPQVRRGNVAQGYVGRQVLQRLYNFSNTLIKEAGLVAEFQNNGFTQMDFNASQYLNDLPQYTVNVIGENIPVNTESELDIQMLGLASGSNNLSIEFINSWIYIWALDYVNRDNAPPVVSISYGWDELQQCLIEPGTCANITNVQYVERMNNEFLKLAVRGVSVFISSGDAGSPGRTSENCENGMNPVYPGSSPWVTSVGATYLVNGGNNQTRNNLLKRKSQSLNGNGTPLNTNGTPLCVKHKCANGTIEDVTWFLMTGWTSGGGFSRFHARPKWQDAQVNRYLQDKTITFPSGAGTRWFPNNRAYPDVSAIGHNCPTVVLGTLQPVDGTSCSAPLFAGLTMILNEYQTSKGRPRIGFANPLFYQMQRTDPSTFHDVLAGSTECTEFKCCGKDFGYVATKGWDAASGLGTPNIGRMMEWLDRHTS